MLDRMSPRSHAVREAELKEQAQAQLARRGAAAAARLGMSAEEFAALSAEERKELLEELDALDQLSPRVFAVASLRECATLAAEAQAGTATARGSALAALDAAEANDATAAAATTLLRVSAVLHTAGRLLVACVDVMDERTMAAALAARLSRASLLNVCDLTPSAHDALVPPVEAVRSTSGDELVAQVVGRAMGCR